MSGRLCRVDSYINRFFQALNKTRFNVPQSETSERSEVGRPIISHLESLKSCWVGRLLYDVKKCKVVISIGKDMTLSQILEIIDA